MFRNVSEKRDWLQIILSRPYGDTTAPALHVFRNGAGAQQLPQLRQLEPALQGAIQAPGDAPARFPRLKLRETPPDGP